MHHNPIVHSLSVYLSPAATDGLFGVLLGAAITLAGESWRDRAARRRATQAVMWGLRRSLSNLATHASPFETSMAEMRQGRSPFIPTWDVPLIAPYLDEGIALTAPDRHALELYHKLVRVKRGVEAMNRYLEQVPLIQTSAWVAAQPIETQIPLFGATLELGQTIYDTEVRRHAIQAAAQIINITDRPIAHALQWYSWWPWLANKKIYRHLRRMGFDRSSAQEIAEQAMNPPEHPDPQPEESANDFHPLQLRLDDRGKIVVNLPDDDPQYRC